MLFVFIYVICIYLCYLYLFTYIGVQHDFNITWCSCRLTVTRVSHVEDELLTLPEHLSSPPVFSEVRVVGSLVVCVCPDYIFGIFKLFLEFLIGSIFFKFGRRSFCRLELISFQVSEVVIAITFCAVTWHKCC